MTIRVMLADDHTVVCDGLCAIFEIHSDIRVIGIANNGLQVISLVQQQCPDVLLIDIVMPGLNGIDAIAQVKQACPHTQIIILSMHASTQFIGRALQVGAAGYVVKDSAGQDVVEAVRTVARGGRYLSPQITEAVVNDYINLHQTLVPKNPLEQLSKRERAVLQLVAEGCSSVEIGDILALSPRTVDTYRSRIMQKLNLSDLPSLIRFAIQQGIIPLE